MGKQPAHLRLEEAVGTRSNSTDNIIAQMHGYKIDTEKRKTCPISFKHASFKHALTVFSKHCNPTENLEQL